MSMSPTMGGESERALFDAYSYMLVEATGDSESDYYDAAAELAEDDAESCSCGFLTDTSSAPEIDDFLDNCFEDDGGGCGCCFVAAEIEDGVVDQLSGGAAAAAELNKSNSKGCEDSKMKLMSETETDRLFWEACLAS